MAEPLQTGSALIAAGYDCIIDHSAAPFAGVLLPASLGSGPYNNIYDLTLAGC
jgi:hypothetical protein